MKSPSLLRVKIVKFMIQRINEPLTLNDFIEGTHSHGNVLIRELSKLTEERLVTKIRNGWKLSFDNAFTITSGHLDLAIICDFKKELKRKNKELDKQK